MSTVSSAVIDFIIGALIVGNVGSPFEDPLGKRLLFLWTAPAYPLVPLPLLTRGWAQGLAILPCHTTGSALFGSAAERRHWSLRRR